VQKALDFPVLLDFLATFNGLWQLSVLFATLTAKLRDGYLPLCFCIGKQE